MKQGSKAPTPRRRRLRWTIRGGLVMVALAAMPMAWVRSRVQAQKRAVAAFARHGGFLHYDFQRVTPTYWDDAREKPPVPRWLRWLPVECFQDVELLILASDHVTDRDLEDVSGLGGLKVFKAGGPGITDAGIELLRLCPELELLVIADSSITDAGVERLASMNSLRRLHLSGTPITDRSLESLGKMAHLESVGFSGTKVTEAGMERWKRLHPKINAYR